MENFYRCCTILLCATMLGLMESGTIASAKDPDLPKSIIVEYADAGKPGAGAIEIPESSVKISSTIRITEYRNESYQVVIHEIDRGSHTEITGELEYLAGGGSCGTLRICIPVSGEKWNWFHGL